MASEAVQKPSTSAPAVTVVLEESAFLFLVLHSMKYPLSAVSGILVGSRSTDTSSTSTVISRVAPMIHTHTSLPGQMEFALALLEARLKELNEQASTNLEIVGYYHCNERQDDLDLGPVQRRIADGVGPLALVLDPKALVAMKERDGGGNKSPFVVFSKASGGKGSWSKANAETALRIPCLGESSWVGRLEEAIGDGDFGGVHDFEEHMEDVTVDFLH